MVHCVVWTREQKKGSHWFSFSCFYISCSSMNVAGEEDLEKYWMFVWRWVDVKIVLKQLEISMNNHTRCIKHDLMSIKTLCSALSVIWKKYRIEADVIWFESGKFLRRGM